MAASRPSDDSVVDAGRVVNPDTLASQVQGA